MYQKELEALKRANRYRQRVIYGDDTVDFASNDYLGLSQNKELLHRAFERLNREKYHAPRASIVVNGYHNIHKEFEDFMSEINGFEATIVAGSGFMANIALLEALPRKKDILILDDEYHASGIVASKGVECKRLFFRHNDYEDLERILKENEYQRAVVAVEGVYSMSGDLLKREIFEICDRFGALLVVDEAHSVGVLGDNLLGVFDYYEIEPKPNHIKMGTLGKALGSYGAYIQSSLHVREYLVNRAKSLIYTTAPSLFDIALAKEGFEYVLKNVATLKEEIKKRRDLTLEEFGYKMEGLIFTFEIDTIKTLLGVGEELIKRGFLVGVIRPPTVKKPILRIIPRVGESFVKYKEFCKILKDLL